MIEILFKSGWAILAFLWAYIHSRKIVVLKISPGGIMDYALRVWIAILFAGAYLLTITGGKPFLALGYWSILYIFVDLFFYAGIFWAVFNISLNILRPDKKWNYVSTTNGKFFDIIFKGSFIKQSIAQIATFSLGFFKLLIF